MSESIKNLKKDYRQSKKEVNSLEERKRIKSDYKEMKKMLKTSDKIIKKNNLTESSDDFWDKFDFPTMR